MEELIFFSVLCILALGFMIWQKFWIITTILRDMNAFLRFTWVQHKVRQAKQNNSTLVSLFEEVVRQNGSKIAFQGSGREWSFSQVDNLSNKIGHSFSADGFGPGDVVCVVMESCVEYVCTWIGLSKLGIVPALVSSQMKGSSFQHCVDQASCKAILCGVNQQNVLNSLVQKCSIWRHAIYVWDTKGRHLKDVTGIIDFQERISVAPSHALLKPEQVGYRSDLLYIYTSGTTGMPKAAKITNSRAIFMVTALHYMFGIQSEDVFYIPLPLYHTSGGVLGVGQTLLFGCTSVITGKFSTQNYWSDVCRYSATVSMYIGELCTYLLAAPETPEERKHMIRMMIGNGLRLNIWRNFEKRFRIKNIREFYGSTEGNASLVNTTNKRGSVGFLSLILPNYYSVALLTCDLTTGIPNRTKDGLCIKCKPGDLLQMDHQGYLYFRDRLGDTFRWKGENVSTLEVESVIQDALGNDVDVAVYGVEVEGQDGKVGMATLVALNNSLELDSLAGHLMVALPLYAVPRFLRICTEVEITETLKLKKNKLQEEGFNPNNIVDALYFLDQLKSRYVLLTSVLYQRILAGKERL